MKLKRHNLKKITGVGLLALGLFGLGVSPIVASELSFATACYPPSSEQAQCQDGATLNVEVTVPPYISITNAESIPSTITISNSTGLSTAQAVTVATNIVGGFQLTAKAISTDTSSTVSNKMLRRDGLGAAVSDTGIDSTATKLTYANMVDKTWGLAVDGTNFRPIARDGVVAESGVIAYSTAPTAGTTTNVTFAAKVANGGSLVAGTYSATIQFTALGNDGTAKTLYGD